MTTKVGREVQAFYNVTPFPDYELKNFNTKNDLRLAAWPFPKILNRSIPSEASIVDVGTGTGQLAAYLSINRKDVLGLDFSDTSLKKADQLKEKLNLRTLDLKKVDILNDEQVDFINKQYDYGLCLGVLHHTGRPYAGFQNFLKLVKPGGFVAVGLYNSYGRLFLKIRKFLVHTIFKNNEKMRERYTKMQLGDETDPEKIRGWWNDQYMHPHESAHTLGEVLMWFDRNNVEYIETLPSVRLGEEPKMEIAGVWNSVGESRPGPIRRFLKQLEWIWSTHQTRGYFVVFGRKRDA